jgi:hypothetical protein
MNSRFPVVWEMTQANIVFRAFYSLPLVLILPDATIENRAISGHFWNNKNELKKELANYAE